MKTIKLKNENHSKMLVSILIKFHTIKLKLCPGTWPSVRVELIKNMTALNFIP